MNESINHEKNNKQKIANCKKCRHFPVLQSVSYMMGRLLLLLAILRPTHAFQNPLSFEFTLRRTQKFRSKAPSDFPTHHPSLALIRSIPRGGGSSPSGGSSATLSDYSGAPASWFGGIRIPASLIVGASFGQLFALAQKTRDTSTLSPCERFAIHAHNGLMLISFLCSLSTVVISTASSVAILHDTFDHFAISGYELLKREFSFEFLTCRLGFLSSLLSFLMGATCRALIEYNLFREERREGAVAVIFAMVGSISWLFSYVNSTLYCWPHLPAMTVDFVKLVWQRARSTGRPLATLSMICFVSSLASAGKLALKGTKRYSTSEEVL
jgi:hypothetical protein